MTGSRPAASSGGSVASAAGRASSSAVHHALADAARRHVDHPPQADVVVRVDDELQVGERVLDFLALVEADAADDLVRRRPRASARLRSCATARWCGRARRRSRPTSSSSARRDGARDEVGLLELVAAAEVDDLRAALAVGPEPLVLAVAVLADDRGRRVEDDLRRAVVAFELDDLRLGEVLLEVEDVPQVGAAPLVDRLVRIADDAQVAVAARRGAESAGTAAGSCPGTRRP